jgi:hypothetical protein
VIDVVTELLALAEAPDTVRLAAVRQAGGRCAIDLVFNSALDVPPHDPEAVRRAVVLIDRIRVGLCHAALDRHSSSR